MTWGSRRYRLASAVYVRTEPAAARAAEAFAVCTAPCCRRRWEFHRRLSLVLGGIIRKGNR